MIIYVDGSALRPGDGTERSPFKTISEAATKALPGDEVLVAPGIYREAVDPRNAGTAIKRITYRSAQKGQAHITGSEPVKSWSHVEGIYGKQRSQTEFSVITIPSPPWFPVTGSLLP